MQERAVKRYGCGVSGGAAGLVVVLWVLSGLSAGPCWYGAVSAAVFIFLSWWGVFNIRRLCREVDRGEDILADVLRESKQGDITPQKREQWSEVLDYRKELGAVSRLYERIWESIQIFTEREANNHKEKQYLREMMTDISHQIKTPLAALQVFLDIFSQEFQRGEDSGISDEGKKADMLELAGQAERQIQRIHWLVVGLLKLTRLESGVLEFDRARHILARTVENCRNALLPLLSRRKLRIECQGEGDVVFEYDEEWLTEAIVNLMKNAAEHSPENGVIAVSWRETPMAVFLSIRDHGRGIPLEEMPKIFNRFYRCRGDGNTEGVGIGLALAKEIIESQNGTLVVYSQQGENSYTEFVATFLKSTAIS